MTEEVFWGWDEEDLKRLLMLQFYFLVVQQFVTALKIFDSFLWRKLCK